MLVNLLSVSPKLHQKLHMRLGLEDSERLCPINLAVTSLKVRGTHILGWIPALLSEVFFIPETPEPSGAG
jgi:hypothetical protein